MDTTMQYEVTAHTAGLVYQVESPNGVRLMVKADRTLQTGQFYQFNWGRYNDDTRTWSVTVRM